MTPSADDAHAGPGLGPGSAPDQRPRHTLAYVARSDRGLVRSTNQDSVFASDRLLVVADGMGGHAAGDKASRLVVDALAPLNGMAPGPELLSKLIDAIRSGNEAIADTVAENPELDGMGTTVTALLFDGNRAALAHVGDSRAYLYRSGVLHQLTHDDTFVQSLVDDGRITERQAHRHPQRNLLLRALTGIELDPSVAVREVRRGDRYLLCSDGLSGVVDPESIADALAHPNGEIAADTLIQLALVAGGPDNVTVVVADVLDTGSDDETPAPASKAAPADIHATNPIERLTREMPRVPLPPIPEEPGAPAQRLDDETDDGADDLDDDFDDDGDAGDGGSDGDRDGDRDDDLTAGRGGEIGGLDTDLAGAGAGSARDARAGAAVGMRGRSRKSRPARHDTRPLPGPARGTPSRDQSLRRKLIRRGSLVTAIVVLIGVAVAGSAMWVRSQYYVSEQGNLVVVFRGVNGSLLGWQLASFEETSCAGDTDCTPMKVSDLQPAARYQVQSGIRATSLSDAREVVKRLSAQLLPPCPPETATREAPPTGTRTSPAPETRTPPGPDTTTEPEPTPGPTTTPRPGSARTAVAGTAAAGTGTGAPAAGQVGTSRDSSRPAGARAAAGEAAAATGSAAPHAPRTDEGAAGAAAGVIAPRTPAPPSTPRTPTESATPLAPAPAVPGVTCRTVP